MGEAPHHAGREANPLLRRWEALRPRWQFAIAFPPASLLLWWGHVALLAQPLWRGLFYGLFWGATLSVLLVVASQTEARKRKGWVVDDDEHDP